MISPNSSMYFKKHVDHPWWLLLPISLLLQLSNAAPRVPCNFIFGDSLADTGNNNNLKTQAKVNYPPYGIDFPKGPTGRFSNGRNIQDLIAEYLGFNVMMPPFATSEGANILQGVNYASGSAGILDETGSHLGVRVPLNMQISNHKTIIDKLHRQLRNESAANELLRKCMYSIQIGSNDYINNYFKPKFYNSSKVQGLVKFTNTIFQQFEQQVKALYDKGGRLFALHGIGPLGCAPSLVAEFGTNGSPCVDTLNNAADLFNESLDRLVNELNNRYRDARFTALKSIPMKSGPVATLGAFLLRATPLVADKPCCPIGGGGGELCLLNSVPCNNRNNYMFWDGVHPSERLNVIIAKSFFGRGVPSKCHPFNVPQLVAQRLNR